MNTAGRLGIYAAAMAVVFAAAFAGAAAVAPDDAAKAWIDGVAGAPPAPARSDAPLGDEHSGEADEEQSHDEGAH